MADNFTILNPGEGGSVMDETAVSYPSSPNLRKRPRIVVSGEGKDAIVPALSSNPDGSEFGIVTRPIMGYPGTSVSAFNLTTLVPANLETTVVNYTVPAGKTFNFIGFAASGNANAFFKLYVSGDIVLAARSSVANLTIQMNYAFSPFQVSEGETILLKAIHCVNSSCDFEGTILGFNL